MSQAHAESTHERRNKRKSILLALLLHGAVVGVFVYPFLVGQDASPQPYEMIVELDFREPPMSSSAANAKEKIRNEVKQPMAEREAAPRNPVPPALPPPPSPPILTAPSPVPVIPDVPAPPVPQPDPIPTPTPSTAPVVVDVPATKHGPVASNKEGHGTTTGTGSSTGAPETGAGSTVSDVGQGRSDVGEGLEGTGVLRRAVIYRPQLNSIVRSNGRIAMNVCVNQNGNVVAVKWNEELSTIEDKSIIRDALAKAADYIFAADRQAPSRECGVITIIVKGLDKLH